MRLKENQRKAIRRVGWGFFYTLWIGLRLLLPSDPASFTGWQPILSCIWGLGFVALLSLLAHALGTYITERWLPITNEDPLLRFILSTALGLGSLALMLSGLAFLQILSRVSVFTLILILAMLLGPQLTSGSTTLLVGAQSIPVRWSRSNWMVRFITCLSLTIGLLTLLNAAVPVWDYDGLMYHLTGPRDFLQYGGIFPDEHIWYVNGTFSVELLFTTGLAFGDVLVPKLIHLTFGVLYALSTWAFTRRWFGQRTAWIALALILGMPALPIWAGFAYIDLAWSLFEWIALATLIEYLRDHDQVHLDISAVFLGFALSAKYLALMGTLVIAALLFWDARHRVRKLIPIILRYGSITLVIAGIWYLKNFLWFGNPVYPLYFGGPGWSSERLRLYNDYLHSFGTGNSILSLISMPITLFTKHEIFGAVMNRNDILNPLFLLIFLVPFTHHNRISRFLVAAAGIRFLLWFIGSQQIRFLLPIDPAFSIIAAIVILEIQGRLKKAPALGTFLPMLSAGLMLITLFYQIQLARKLQPWNFLTGGESTDGFLTRNVGDYAAAHYIQTELSDQAQVLLLGDGRSYYCSPKCIPDPDHFRWAAKIIGFEEFQEFKAWAESRQITYLLLSIEDADFLLQHDESGIIQEALEKVTTWRKQGCLEEVYSDTWTRIYSIECALSEG